MKPRVLLISRGEGRINLPVFKAGYSARAELRLLRPQLCGDSTQQADDVLPRAGVADGMESVDKGLGFGGPARGGWMAATADSPPAASGISANNQDGGLPSAAAS